MFAFIVMSLPVTFQSPSEYFEKSLNFFHEYQHLYNFANTDLLIVDALAKISIDNLENIDVLDTNFDLRTVDSIYLKDFFRKYERLLPKYDEFGTDETVDLVNDVPLSLKKKHEILYLAKEIKNVCTEFACDTVVDFGSGLGYLDQQLFETTNCNVLGLECNDQHYVGAKKRQRKYHINSTDRVKYVKHTIDKDSTTKIKEYVDDKFPNSGGVCIVGLHACADLTVDAMNIFLKMNDVRSIVIMPCCYHRLQKNTSDSFQNFPISSTLKSIYENQNFEFLTVPFLRLATQSHIEYVNRLNNLVFNLLARAVLQLYVWKHKYKLKRKKRKAVRLNTIHKDFEEYIKDAAIGFSLIYDSSSNNEELLQICNESLPLQFDFDNLISIWRQIDDLTFKKCAIFVLLQNYLQPVLENFVLYDRLVYLQENNVMNCKFKKILNSNISPRCLALIANK